MKNVFILGLIVVSFQAFSGVMDTAEYTGSNDGAACKVWYNSSYNHVSLGGVSIDSKQRNRNGNVLIIEGGADFVDARVTLLFKSNNELSSAKLETKNVLLPFYLTKLVCTDLVRTK